MLGPSIRLPHGFHASFPVFMRVMSCNHFDIRTAWNFRLDVNPVEISPDARRACAWKAGRDAMRAYGDFVRCTPSTVEHRARSVQWVPHAVRSSLMLYEMHAQDEGGRWVQEFVFRCCAMTE